MPLHPAASAAPRADPLAFLTALAALLATTAPSLLAYNLPPSATLFNQCLALSLWGGFIAVLAPGLPLRAWRDSAAAQAALAVVAAGVLWSWLGVALPSSLAWSALTLLASAAVLAAAGAAVAARADGQHVFTWVLLGTLLAGLLGVVIAVLQVFAPAWTDGDVIARSGLPGRAVGNLRQPNHLSSLLLWAAIAAAALMDLRRLPRALAAPLFVLLVGAVVLSGSRTGALGMLLLAAWGALDHRLSRATRVLLMAAPLVYGGWWLADAAWSQATQQTLGVEFGAGSQRGDISSSRFGIWSNTLALIAREPLLGVGFGEFNLAWALTPFPGRPVALFDHTHNIALQFAVELGVPAALLALGLLARALWQAWQRAAAMPDDRGRCGRAAFVLVAMMALHSQLEYPLWYAYFLLPTAFAWGFAMARPAPRAVPAEGGGSGFAGLVAGVAMALGGALAVLDYMQVVVIFAPPAQAASLEQRIARGQRSVFFAHHADYAAVTTGQPDSATAQALAWRRAPHHLLDTRLMIAWARALEAEGQDDLARHVAARLREFRKPEADEFFAECALPGAAPAEAFQCLPPQRAIGWREFLNR